MKKIKTTLIGYYTTAEACKALGVCPQTLYNWRERALIQPIQVGNVLFLTDADVAKMSDYVAQHGSGVPYSKNAKPRVYYIEGNEPPYYDSRQDAERAKPTGAEVVALDVPIRAYNRMRESGLIVADSSVKTDGNEPQAEK